MTEQFQLAIEIGKSMRTKHLSESNLSFVFINKAVHHELEYVSYQC